MNAIQFEPRFSSSGRKIHNHYHNEISLEDITHSTNQEELDDLHHDRINRINEKRATNMITIREFIQQKGYNTILDLFLDELNICTKRQKTGIQQALNKGGVSKILSFCIPRPDIRYCPAVQKEICEYANQIFTREIEQLVQSAELRQPINMFQHQSSFSFEKIRRKIELKAPDLLNLFESLASRKRPIPNNNIEMEDDEDWIDEDILHNRMAMDVDNQDMDTESVDIAMKEIYAEDSEESEDPSEESEDIDIEIVLSRREKRHRRIVTTAISALCYSRTRHSNLFQVRMGHYFSCARTPKRPIEVAHQLGISVSYSSIAAALVAIAMSVKEAILTIAILFPSFFISFDNMNIFARVKGERLHNQERQLNLTSAWVGVNPESRIKHMLTSADIDPSRANRLKTSDLLPNARDTRLNLKTSQYGIFSALNAYFGDELKEYTTAKGEVLPLVTIPRIYRLPLQKTIVYTFPCFNKNEAIVSEVGDILQEIAQQMNLTHKDLQDKKVMHKGDWLTVRNMGYLSLNMSFLME